MPCPSLPGSVIVRDTPDELFDALSADLLIQARNCVRAFGDFHLALSGGTTPEPFYRRLMYDPLCRDLPWIRTHLWQVDERCVPPDDERSNYGMIHDIIVQHSGIPREQVHPIPAMTPDAAERYEAELREYLGWRERGHDRLDFVLLGIGTDGHTASLFPHSPALRVRGRLVVANEGPTVPPPPRITMTADFINTARFVAVLATGEHKRPALARVVSRCESPEALPILGIRPVAGELRWYLDRTACP